jgi:hypothetical protein
MIFLQNNNIKSIDNILLEVNYLNLQNNKIIEIDLS